MNHVKDGNKSLFYDTYALCAIALAEQSYKEFSQGIDIQTSLMNLYELYYILIKEGHEETAEKTVYCAASSSRPIPPDAPSGRPFLSPSLHIGRVSSDSFLSFY